MKKIWMRAGVSLLLDEKEIPFLLSKSVRDKAERDTSVHVKPVDLVNKAIKQGRFRFDGSSYIPGPTIDDFNRQNGTEYPAEDIDFELDPNLFRSPGWAPIKGSILRVLFTDNTRELVELDPGKTVDEMVAFMNGQGFKTGRWVYQVDRIEPWSQKATTLYQRGDDL